MEPEGSLQHAKVPAPVHKMSQINPNHTHIPFPEDPFLYIYIYTHASKLINR